MYSYDELISNKPDANRYCMKLQLNNKQIIKEYYPLIKAPSSTVLFWCNRLTLYKRIDIKDFDNFGYCCIEELIGELKGFYKFYEKCR